MGFAGFGGAPVYVVLPSPGGSVVPPTDTSGPHLQELLRNLPYTPSTRGVTIYELPEGSNQQTARVSCVGVAGEEGHHDPRVGMTLCSTYPIFLSFLQGADSSPQSAASSQGSVGSRWSTASGGSHGDDRSAGRARWGDRGVGVGHLWAPGEETVPGSRGGDSMPPAWAEKEEENVLPGAPYSKPEQR